MENRDGIKMAAPAYGTLLAICCGLAFASYLGSYMRIPVVPLFAVSLGAGTVEVGLINAAFLLMSGLLSFPLGLLSDRWGRKPLIVTGLLVSMGTSLMLFFSQTPGQLIWIYLLFGSGLAAIGPTLMSYVADISPATHLGRSYGWYTTAIYSGMSVGPALGGFIAHWLGFRPLFLIAGAFILLIVGASIWLLPGSRGASAASSRRVQKPATLKQVFKNIPLLGCWLATLGSCFAQGMFVTFAPLHGQNQGLNLGQIGLLFTVQAVCNAMSRLPLGRLSDTVTHRGRLAALGLCCFAVSLAAFGFCRTLITLLAATVALGFSMGLAFTPLGALIAETVPPESRGLALGGYNACIYLGMMLSSGLMGGVIEVIGFARGFLLTGVLTLLVTGVFYWLLKDFSLRAASGEGAG
jgi:MFS transporter, DHA1 family, multidrug resistance protein